MEVEDVDAELAAWAERTKQCPKKGDDGTDYKDDKEEYPEKKKETKKAPKKEESYEEEGSGEEVRSVCCGKLRISCCGWAGYDSVCHTAARRCTQRIQLPPQLYLHMLAPSCAGCGVVVHCAHPAEWHAHTPHVAWSQQTLLIKQIPRGSRRMRFTWLDPGGQCHCCLAKMSM